MNKKKITTTLPNGIKKEYDVLFTFKNEKTEKDYIVYTDNSVDSENKLRIFASIYNPETLELIGAVETKEEWDEIYRLLDKILLNE